MPPSLVTLTLDTRAFNRALEQYHRLSKSLLPDILNRRAFFIALRCLGETNPAQSKKILRDLSTRILADRQKGRPGHVRRRYAIVQRKRANAGEAGLYGEAMRKAAHEFVRRRLRSRGMLREGWLPAVAEFAALVPTAQRYLDRTAKVRNAQRKAGHLIRKVMSGRFNRTLGSAQGATQGQHRATLTNRVILKGERASAIEAAALAVLQKAVTEETEAMIRETERRLDALTKGRR